MSSEGDTSTQQRAAKEPKLDCYAILGVHPNAEDVVIRAAFKALAQRYHPDRFSGSKDEAHRRMSDLTHAYEILCDPVRRSKYDHRRRLKAHGASYQLRDGTKDDAPSATIASPVTAAARHRRYRQAVVVLVGAVVVLSAFNLYQYSGRLKSWVGSSPSSASTSPVTTRGAAETPIPIVTNTSPEPPVELPVARPKALTTAPTGSAQRVLGETTGPSGASIQEPPSATTPPRMSPRTASAEPSRTPVAPASVPASRKDAVVAPPAAPIAAANPPAAPPKAAPAKSAATPAESLGVARTTVCTDGVIALGLCKTDTTAAKAP